MGDISVDPRIRQDPGVFLKLLNALWDSGEFDKALQLLARASTNLPAGAGEVFEKLLRARGVPQYHLGMVADQLRNEAYEAAIKRAAPNSRHALDLGAGSGLLAMMAARAGAPRVTACEADVSLARTAQEIVAANGYSGKVDVLPVHSSKLDREADLMGGVDLIITETFGSNLVSEAVLSSVSDAVQRLATPDVQVIPARAAAVVALATFDRTMLPSRAGEICGFNLSPLNRHQHLFKKVLTEDPRLELRSEPATLFDFNLHDREHPTTASTRLVSTSEYVDGIAQWIRLQLDEDSSYENRPGSCRTSHWQVILWPFEERTRVPVGHPFDVFGIRVDDSLIIWSPSAPDSATVND